MKRSRREFLQHSCLTLGASALASSLERFGLINAMAASPSLAAGDYKALVCVFLFGGNDGNNAVIPFETAEYNAYAAVRGQSTAGGLGIPQANLLQINAPSHGRRFGLHPALTELQTIYNAGKAAVLCNTGTLLQPLTKAQFQQNRSLRPDNLFSHDDQQAQWQTAISNDVSRTGWGGRLADVTRGLNAGEPFPPIATVSGVNLFVTGAQTRPIAIPQSGTFGLRGFNTSAASVARFNAMQQLLTLDRGSALVNATSDTMAQAVGISTTLNSLITNASSAVAPLFANLNSSLAAQLFQVAKVIEGRASTRLSRQIFFVSMGGFDTHNGQINAQQDLFRQLAPALKAFYDATVQLGVASNVTTFTLSDFGRTFKPASGGGTDHAWGNHHFVIGGAVRGGNFYGQFPALTLNGPNDVSDEGRWLPTTSVDQYASTLALWFGAGRSDLATVFPNLARFPTDDLGFMS